MNSNSPASARISLPAIVPVVLAELAALRREGQMGPAKFEAQLRRLEREEITPRALKLHHRQLADGRTSFVVSDTRGRVHEVLEFPKVNEMRELEPVELLA